MMTDNERFTKDCILAKVEPVLLNGQKIPENAHTMKMVGLSGVKFAFAIFEENDKEKRLKLITDACMEKYEITDDDLVTCIHLRQHMYKFDTLANALGMAGHDGDFPIYALTNDRMHFGAGMLFVDSILRKVVETIGCDFYILPSSVHELLFVPVNNFAEDEDREEVEDRLLEMVWDVNHSQVEPHERLSNHVYFVDSKTLTFRTIRAKRLI